MKNFIAPLHIGEGIGKGAFGEVFHGIDPIHGDVALKILRKKPTWSDEIWQRWRSSFLSEGQNLSKASHEHVVQVHHIVISEDRQSVLLCMQFCPGGSLQTAFDHGPLPISEVCRIGTDVLLGLSALHARGMLHRDIKPANILLDNRGNALIGDFGLVTDDIAHGYADEAGYYDHLAYETWHGKGTSVRSDIWAFGATIYRLLHGNQWYSEAPEPKEIIKYGGFADGLKWLPHIPKRWRRVIRQMMEDDTTKRYQSAEQALDALSSLPVAPAWQATVQNDIVRWTLPSGKRIIVVEWKRVPRKNEWVAWSEPNIGQTGRKRILGASGGIVSSKQASSDLENFFNT